ncbi:hypothetical protein OG909_19760 [Streptomyces sp. NBC_01754]|uniref:hypothetical protein n=1 Tax=Streptomyces sp. NBC_01754 TaxID=2975930 RepID=UPI002DDAA0E9|nr:hypothetical protein [Streptomyces sp. NBC_01754]WSC94324.1 hypothetical protein OG909_19760 [Streptomyces sp. NBC_01754]
MTGRPVRAQRRPEFALRCGTATTTDPPRRPVRILPPGKHGDPPQEPPPSRQEITRP